MDVRAEFERAAVEGGSAGEVRTLAQAARTGAERHRLALAAALAHAAFIAPGRIAEIYDAAAEGWFGAPVAGPPIDSSGALAAAPPPPEFWAAFWDLVDAQGLDAGTVTSRTAALGGHLDAGFGQVSARACLAYPGVAQAAAGGVPDRFQLSDLAACPQGALGEAFYRLIVDNQFDLEVLDRDALGLSGLIPPLDYLNARMLQTHDLWHIVAGYRTTGLHEIGISGFQMAQFGHGYSAMFLAMVATKIARAPVEAAAMITDVILSGWVHGRRTPPMLAIPWEQVWDHSTDEIRVRYGVRPYESPYPADVFEQLRSAQTPVAG